MDERRTRQAEPLTLARLVAILHGGWRVIVCITVAVALLAMAGLWVADNWHPGSRGEVQTAVEVRHPAALRGLAPDGKAFDINGLKAAKVLRAAVDTAALPTSPSLDALASAISIQAVTDDEALPGGLLMGQAELLEEYAALNQETTFPVRFVVRLNVRDNLGLSVEDARVLLDAIIYQYRLAWAEVYSGYAILSDAPAGKALDNGYDYIQTAALLDGQAQDLEAYVRRHLPDEAFRSASTGLGRGELLGMLADVRDTGTGVLYNHIFADALTKNAAGFAALCEGLAGEAKLAARQKQTETQALHNVLQTSGGDAERVLQYTEAGIQAERKAAEAAFFQQKADWLRSDVAISGPGTKAAARAQELTAALADRLSALTAIVNETVRDRYLEVVESSGVAQLFPAGSYGGAQASGGVNTTRNLIIAVGAGLVLGLLVVMFRAYMPARTAKKKEPRPWKVRSVLVDIAILLAISLLVTYLLPYAVYGAFGHTAARLTLAYDGADKGLAPDGGALDIRAITSDEVLNAALAKGEYGNLNAETLRGRLQVLPVLNTDPTRAVIYGTQQGPGLTEQAAPTQVWPISYDIRMETGLPGDEEALLNNIIEAYLATLEASYISNTGLSGAEPQYGDALDLRESALALLARAELLAQRAGRYMENASAFRDDGSAQDFAGVSAEAQAVAAHTLRQTLDEIDTYALSGDAAARTTYDEALLARQQAERDGLSGGVKFVLGQLGTRMTAAEPPDAPVETQEDTAADAAELPDTVDGMDGHAEEAAEPPPSEEIPAATPDEPYRTGNRDAASALLARYQEDANALTALEDELGRTVGRLALLREGNLRGGTYTAMVKAAQASVADAAAELDALETHLEGLARECFETEYRGNITVSGGAFVYYRFGNPAVNFILFAGLWLFLCWAVWTLLGSARFIAFVRRITPWVRATIPIKKSRLSTGDTGDSDGTDE